jgi:hypothetical protein
MTELVAEAAGAAAPVGQGIQIWMGGAFDTMLAGLPVYFWIIFLGVIAFIGVVFLNWYKWDTIRSVSGHWDAIRKNIPEAIKITKNMRMKLVPAVYADQIFEWEDPNEIEKWHLTSPHSVGQLGPVNTAILVDYHDWVDNPIYNESIKVAAEIWNEANPMDQIHHYEKYALYRHQGKLQQTLDAVNLKWNKEHPDEPQIPKGMIQVPSYFWVDWSAQGQYLPDEEDAASNGGYLRREASRLKTGDNEEKKNYGSWILGGCVAIGIVIIVFSYLVGSNMMS